MEAELKTILTVLLDKVERIDAQMPMLATKDDIARLDGRMDRLEGRMDSLEGRMDGLENRMGGLENRMGGLENQMGGLQLQMSSLEGRVGGLEGEQRQVKEMLGNMRLKEIGRLDGRIDQLTMEVALGRKPAAG